MSGQIEYDSAPLFTKTYEHGEYIITDFRNNDARALKMPAQDNLNSIIDSLKTAKESSNDLEKNKSTSLNLYNQLSNFISLMESYNKDEHNAHKKEIVNLDKLKSFREQIRILLATTSKLNIESEESLILKTQIELLNAEIQRTAQEAEHLKTEIVKIEETLSSKTEPINSAASAAEKEIRELTKNIGSLAAHKSQELVLGNYRDSAIAEKKISDRLRKYSTLSMFTAVFFAAYTLVTSPGIVSLEIIILKISISILLSIPATYFAKESAKHRRQQYLYQQYALNLDALNPFIAELETTDKNTIKAEIARKLFTSSHEATGTNSGDFPINPNELLALLIQKLDLRPAAPRIAEKTETK